MKREMMLAILCGGLAACAPEATRSPIATPSAPTAMPTHAPDLPVRPPTGDIEAVQLSAFAPRPTDSKLARGQVYIDQSQIIVLDAPTRRAALSLIGTLPTPCNQLRLAVESALTDRRVNVTAYSVTDPEVMCVQVIAPLNVVVLLDSFAPGEHILILNGDEIGPFTS